MTDHNVDRTNLKSIVRQRISNSRMRSTTLDLNSIGRPKNDVRFISFRTLYTFYLTGPRENLPGHFL